MPLAILSSADPRLDLSLPDGTVAERTLAGTIRIGLCYTLVFSIDLRHGDADTVRALGDQIPEICETARGACEVTVQQLLYDEPLQFPVDLRQGIAAAADRLGIDHMELPSPAGDGARYLHYICPTAMIFIPCKDGISHNEAESITPAGATAGAGVLAEALIDMAEAL